MDVEQCYVRFLGNLVLNLWDCGGQEAFMEHYFTAQRDNIFRNVEVLIYVFDVESREIDRDIHYYQSCLESMATVMLILSLKIFIIIMYFNLKHSPKAKIFCLIHKMDLVMEHQREAVR